MVNRAMNRAGPSARRRRWLIISSALVTLTSVLVMYWRVPLGDRGHWQQCYAPQRVWENVRPAAIALGVLCVAVAVLLPFRRRLSRSRRWAALAGLTGLSFIAYVLTATAGRFDALELVAAFMLPRASGSYYCEAERIGPYYGACQKRNRSLPIFANVRQYLDQYAEYQPTEIFPGDTMRVITHPPGPSLFCYSVQAPLRRSPILADTLIVLYRFVFRGEYGRQTFVLAPYESGRLFLAGIATTGLAVLAVASLLAPAVLCASRRLRLGSCGAVAFGLSALFPSLHLYSPGIDQLFPLLAVAFWTMLMVACRHKSVCMAALSGALFFVCMGFTLAFAVVLAVPVAVACIYWVRGRDRSARAWEVLRIAVPLALGFCLLAVCVWLSTGYDALGSWARCYRNNRQFNLHTARGYWQWLLHNPVMFLLFLGGPTVTLWLAGTCAALRRTWRRGRVVGRDWLSLAVAGVVVLLWISGINRGEVERLWMFLMPACLLAGLAGLRLRFDAADSLVLLMLQAAQVAVFRVCYDAWDAARYFAEDFLPGVP